ncbi:hypothetical protein MNBD_NITROSPINAE04-912 [hydrothermal vent metagenome]|uniref:PpiC domain-containing protein n=1 Tax=hydrothermal vent metagenome TaxID=652676 RepID=A0A3B1BPA1_9ZZZZ
MSHAEITDRIVANVNGEIILLSDIRKQTLLLKNLKETGDAKIPDSALTEEAILRKMIDEKIMAHYAKENNVTIKESEIDKAIERIKVENGFTGDVLTKLLEQDGMSMEQYREKLRDQMLIRRISGIEVGPVTISDEEVKNFYRKNKRIFTEQGKVRASHIVLLLPEDASAEKVSEVERKINSIMKEIRGGADFAEMARKYSQDGSSVNGGDLGWFSKGKMLPDFERVAFSMEKGEVSSPIRTRFGYHIIKVVDREEPKATLFKDVAEGIRRKISADASVLKRREWLERLRAQAYVEILY